MPAVAATWAFRMPPAMGIPILINLLPPEISWKVVDQNIEPVDYSDDADIIAISYFTPQAGFAYEIGDEFLRRERQSLPVACIRQQYLTTPRVIVPVCASAKRT